jgi:Domain of unknown function (DUF4338)
MSETVPQRGTPRGPSEGTPRSKAELREAVLQSLRDQGFEICDGAIVPPTELDKDGLRALHAGAVAHQVAKARHNLVRHETRLLGHLADGASLDPSKIRPRLVAVERGSEQELLFRWARLHWSVPTSAGYGRRLRFLVIDEHNDKLIGLIGLGDPVMSLGPRDRWIGWDRTTREAGLRPVLDAHVLGAVPPYSQLLGGKLVALLATSVEVRAAFAAKYAGRESVISGAEHDGQLALITTTSALGRSSMYNRLRYCPNPPERGRLVFEPVGFTQGTGQFQFANGLYGALTEYALANVAPTAKSEKWGSGFRNRREVVTKSLISLGLNPEGLYSGVVRQALCAPLGANTREFLRGEDRALESFQETADELAEFWRERWLLGRAKRDQSFREFKPASWELWDHAPGKRGRPRKY